MRGAERLVTTTIAEWSYVSRPLKLTRPNQLKYYPYVGPKWYHKAVVGFLLDREIVERAHVLYSFQPSVI